MTNWVVFASYLLLQPILRIISKSPYYAVQSILHALFLPTPFKQAQLGLKDDPKAEPTEILKPGSLYSECSVVRLHVPTSSPPTDSSKPRKEDLELPDDGELGGQEVGRLVWESYEQQLKLWDRKKDHSQKQTQTSESAKNK